LDRKFEAIRQAFRDQAPYCDKLGSPFTARVCRLLAERLDPVSEVGAHIANWPGDFRTHADNVPLRLCGALNHLVLTRKSEILGDAYPPRMSAGEPDDAQLWMAVGQALENHADEIIGFLANAPQTNEVRRSVALLPAYHQISERFGLPLSINELGASAGLNLHAYCFAINTDEFTLGKADADLLLSPQWFGETPRLAQDLAISSTRGCDLNPVNIFDADERLRLLSYIWPDQRDRVERTKAAISISLNSGAHAVERSDAIKWLEARLKHRKDGEVAVFQHTIAWQYFPDELKDRGENLFQKFGREATKGAPIARIAMEADGGEDGAALDLTIWPNGTTHRLGRVDFHGRWVSWVNPVYCKVGTQPF